MNQHEIKIQRLVDGELNEQDRIAFLKAIENDSQAWREVALAFVENQLWCTYAMETAALSDHEYRFAHTDGKVPAPDVAVKSVSGSRRPGNRGWWKLNGPRLMLTAAATLFALAIIVRFGPLGGPPAAFQIPSTGEPEQSESPESRIVTSEPYLLQVGDDLQVPLFPQFDRLTQDLARNQLEVNPAVQREFLDAGYHLQPDLRFISGRVPEDGRTFLIPVHGWRVKPYVQ